MEVRRISPEDGILREIINQRNRLRSVETRPSGSIVIRESITTTDPDTGVETWFGRLPDGSFGLEEWVNDVTPPNKPSTPSVEGMVGGLTLNWDGFDEFGAVQPDDYSYTVAEVSLNGTDWVFGTKITNTSTSGFISALPGDYLVRLQSFDQRGNASVYSGYASGTALSVMDSEEIRRELDQFREVNDEMNEELIGNREAQRQLGLDMEALRNRVNPVESGLATIRNTTIPALQTSVNGKSVIVRATNSPPTTVAPYADGDRWEKWSTLSNGGVLLQSWRPRGTVWVEEKMDPTYLPKVDIGEGTFGSLSGGRIISGSVEADKIAIGLSGNLIPNGAGEWGKSGAWSEGISWNTNNYPTGLPGSFISNGSSYVPPNILFDVEPNTEYYFEVWLKANKADSHIFIEMRNQDGVHGATWTVPAGSTGAGTGGYPVSNYKVPTGWTKLVAVGKTLTTTNKLKVGTIYFNHVNGTVRDATQYIAGMRLLRRNSGELIVNGSIKADQIDSQSVAADIGRFLSISTDQLVAGTAQINKLVADRLFADIIAGRKFYANQLVIGAPGNIFPDPNFEDTDAWVVDPMYTIVQSGGRNGNNAFAVAASASQVGRYYGINDRTRMMTTSGGARYYASVWAKAGSAAAVNDIRLYGKWVKPDGNSGGDFAVPSAQGNTAPMVANVWQKIEYSFTVDEAANKFFIGFYVQGTANTRVLFSEPVVKEVITNQLIVDGAITARKLETDMVLATRIIAGIPDGTRAEMSPNGFRVFAQDPGTNTAPYEVVRMGFAASNDYFAVTKADGAPVASISSNGTVSGTRLYATDSLYLQGFDIADILNVMPKGVVARGWQDFGANGASNNLLIGSNSWYGIATTSFIPEPDRTYQIVLKKPLIAASGGGESQWAIRYRWVSATDTSAPTQANTLLHDQYLNPFPGPGAWHNDTVTTHFDTDRSNIGKRLQLLITSYCGPSTNTGYFRLWGACTLSIIDLGTTSYNPVYHTSAGGAQYGKTATAAQPVKQTYTKQYVCNNSRSYLGSNATFSAGLSTKLYQGQSPVSGQGNLKSIALFPNMTGDLSTAEINRMRVLLHFEHWHYDAGGTARIGLHGHTTLPTTFTSSGVFTTSASWPKPASRWIEIPSAHFGSFKSGTYRGITLEGDGSLTTYGYAARPTIEVTYTK